MKPKLKLRIKTNYLASIFKGVGTTIRKDGLAAYVDMDWSVFGTTAVFDPVQDFVLIQNITGPFTKLALSDVISASRTTLTGDVTATSSGITSIGAGKVTSVMLNADVYSTAHTWTAAQTLNNAGLALRGDTITTGPSIFQNGSVLTTAGGTVGHQWNNNANTIGLLTLSNAGNLNLTTGAFTGKLSGGTNLPIATGVSGLATGISAFLAAPTSANLRSALTDEVGTGAAYFVGGALGTPASGTATNLTGLPIAGISGLGTGVGTALAVNVGTAGSPVVNGGALGTPASGTGTNLTGIPIDAGTINTLPVSRGGTGNTNASDEMTRISSGALEFVLSGANFNSTADQSITLTLPTGRTRYQVLAVLVSNPSISLTTAVGGIYTASAKGGIAVVPASQAYSALTNNTPGSSGSMTSVTVTNGSTAFFNSNTLYLSLTTAQGAAATADLTIQIRPLP